MSVNLSHIVVGWSRSMGMLKISRKIRKMSEARIKICAVCPNAKQSSFLKVIAGRAENLGAIYCGQCRCPVNEKSLVEKEQCPIGSWEQ